MACRSAVVKQSTQPPHTARVGSPDWWLGQPSLRWTDTVRAGVAAPAAASVGDRRVPTARPRRRTCRDGAPLPVALRGPTRPLRIGHMGPKRLRPRAGRQGAAGLSGTSAAQTALGAEGCEHVRNCAVAVGQFVDGAPSDERVEGVTVGLRSCHRTPARVGDSRSCLPSMAARPWDGAAASGRHARCSRASWP